MDENIWDRFDTIATPSEVKAEESRFTPIPAGRYQARLSKIAPAETQSGLPMLKGEFIRSDNGGRIFYNQTLQNINKPEITARNIATACAFVSKLAGEDVVYSGMSSLANFINNIAVGGEYILDISYGDKDFEHKFAKIKIVERIVEEDELPFN